jgi:hypothetical protein
LARADRISWLQPSFAAIKTMVFDSLGRLIVLGTEQRTSNNDKHEEIAYLEAYNCSNDVLLWRHRLNYQHELGFNDWERQWLSNCSPSVDNVTVEIEILISQRFGFTIFQYDVDSIGAELTREFVVPPVWDDEGEDTAWGAGTLELVTRLRQHKWIGISVRYWIYLIEILDGEIKMKPLVKLPPEVRVERHDRISCTDSGIISYFDHGEETPRWQCELGKDTVHSQIMVKLCKMYL